MCSAPCKICEQRQLRGSQRHCAGIVCGLLCKSCQPSTSVIMYDMTAGEWALVRTYLHVTRMIDVNLTFGFLGVPQRTGGRGVDVTVSWGCEAWPRAIPAIANHIENAETPYQVSHPAKSACLAGLRDRSDLERSIT